MPCNGSTLRRTITPSGAMNSTIETRGRSVIQSVPHQAGRVRTQQLSDMLSDWLLNVAEEAKRVAPMALVVALRILR